MSLICLGYLARIGQHILAPFLFAFLLSLLFLPLANFLERKFKFARSLSTFSSVIIMLVILSGISYFFANQLSDLSKDWPSLKLAVSNTFNHLQVWVSEHMHINFGKQWAYLTEAWNKVLSSSGIILGTTFSIFSSGMAFIVFSIIFFIFILNYRRILHRFIKNVFPFEHRTKVQEIIFEIQVIIKKYISGLFIQIFIVSILTSITLSIIGVKYAILLGVLTGLINVIPYLGILTACLISGIISFATGGTSDFVFVILAYLGIHAIDANIVLPLVVGSKVKINPLFSFLAILVGESLWGISGMFLAIPFLAIVKIIFDRVDELKPWGHLMGEDINIKKKKRRFRISKNITLEEKE